MFPRRAFLIAGTVMPYALLALCAMICGQRQTRAGWLVQPFAITMQTTSAGPIRTSMTVFGQEDDITVLSLTFAPAEVALA